jgi:dihydropyrimidinase
MAFDLVIGDGTLITASDCFAADIGISEGRISAIGHNLNGQERVDASGMYVLPGAVDPHVHLAMDAGSTRSSDDWHTGTIAAAMGGTTTVVDFVEPNAGASLLGALEARLAAARPAVVDYALHMTLRSGDAETLAQVGAAAAAGCTSFKVYTTYDGFRLGDAELLAAFEAIAATGGLVLVHAESDALVRHAQEQHLQASHTEPGWHPHSRPPASEAEAIERVLAFAEATRCPVYIVHVSTARGADAVARAVGRGQTAFGETCPQYLLLTEAEYERPGFEAARYVCSPPLRSADNLPSLWQHLAVGSLHTVGTDHCPFFYETQKVLGRARFTDIPNGLPGVESRLALLHTFGVGQGWLSLNRWVEVCCTAPARLLGLADKGTLRPGADADVVVFDPHRRVTLTHAMLHENVDYTPYEGLRLQGYPAVTVARGKVICAGGQFLGAAGDGRFIARRAGSPAAVALADAALRQPV